MIPKGLCTGESDAVTATFDLFDSSSGPDLTLSPQTFTNSAEAFINDNSNSLGVSTESDTGRFDHTNVEKNIWLYTMHIALRGFILF
ncbi:unnamed protein product [Phaedon cochleariae]|uniref:Uncharacterized protein n=1 Tax=Phaedon cochleariae TaxID=80249 RepID=A0A9N9SI89_PHACE|nr:unnamed protein product [Phaedon cochleariae]